MKIKEIFVVLLILAAIVAIMGAALHMTTGFGPNLFERGMRYIFPERHCASVEAQVRRYEERDDQVLIFKIQGVQCKYVIIDDIWKEVNRNNEQRRGQNDSFECEQSDFSFRLQDMGEQNGKLKYLVYSGDTGENILVTVIPQTVRFASAGRRYFFNVPLPVDDWQGNKNIEICHQ